MYKTKGCLSVCILYFVSCSNCTVTKMPIYMYTQYLAANGVIILHLTL